MGIIQKLQVLLCHGIKSKKYTTLRNTLLQDLSPVI